jgi:uncharacterized membrane protein YfcA
MLLAGLIYVAELDPQTSISTAFVAVAAAYLAALAAPALRRRIERPVVGPMMIPAFAAALGAGALGGFLPDRLQFVLISLSMVALAARGIWTLRRPYVVSGDTPPPAPRPLALGGAALGGLGGLLGFPPGSLATSLLHRLTALPAAEATATAIPVLLATALGGAVGHALHARPDLGLFIVTGSAAVVGALLRGAAPPRERSRAGQIVVSLALLALGLVVVAREICPATWFPNL